MTTVPSDGVLVRYLLGLLPDEEAERLDELAVGDDAVARRLEAVENDLVDDFVRGALDGDVRAQFEAHFLSTARGREKVRFARALVRSAAAAPERRTPARAHLVSRGLLAAAAVVLVVAGSVFVARQTRDPGGPAPTDVARQPDVALPPQTAPTPPPATAPPTPLVVAFALPPARRGIAQPLDIRLPAAASEVILRLELEGDDFPEYAAVVRETATGRILHEASRLRSQAFGDSRIVPLSVPASSLPPTHAVVELTGRKPGEASEPLSTYPFRVIAR